MAEGTIVWSSNKRCGLRFTSALSVKDWLAAPTMAEQQRVDAIVSLVKAGAIPTAFAGTGNLDAPSAHRAKRRLVDDLEDVVRLMQDLEGDLASSQETLSRHGMKLQNLDIAMQMVRAIANELTPARDGAHSREAALEDLRVVCAQALAKSEDK